MHFERIRKKLNFVNAWKLFLAKEKEKQIQIWASTAQWNVKIFRGLE